MVDLSDREIDAALERGEAIASNEARAASARYDREARRVVVHLTNACTFAFPPELAQGLEKAADDQLAQIEVLGGGYGLHWPALGVDLTVPGLLSGLFGTASFMARRGGRSTSASKAAAARANGAKGGRPRRTAGA